MKPILQSILRTPGLRAIAAASSRRSRPSSKPEPVVIKPAWRDFGRTLQARGLDVGQVGQILEEALTGDIRQQAELFDIMEDGWDRLRVNLLKVKSAVRKMEWAVRPACRSGNEPTAEARERAALLEAALDGFQAKPWKGESNFEGTLFDLMDSVGKGVAVLELDWYSSGGYWLTRATRLLPPESYGLDRSALDGESGVLKLFPDRATGEPVDFDRYPNKFLVAHYRTKSGSFAGSALLRALAALWAGRTLGHEWLVNRAQLFGLPIRWASYDPHADPRLVDEICNMLANMGSAGWGAFPRGTDLQLLSPQHEGARDPNERLMALADRACDILILGQTLTTDVGSSGSRALGEIHREVELDLQEQYASFVAEVLNEQWVPSVMELNYGECREMPWLQPVIERPRDELAMAERDRVLFSEMRLPVAREWLYQRHGIPAPRPGETLFGETASGPDEPGMDASRQRGEPARTDQRREAGPDQWQEER